MNGTYLHISFYAKMLSSKLHTYISLAYSLVSYYFWFMMVSLAEYILVLRVYSLLLQMTSSIVVATNTAFSLQGMRTRPVGMVSVSLSFQMLLLDVTQNWLY
jgi:hypothetical protein